MKKSILLIVLTVLMFSGTAFAENGWGPILSYWNTDDAGDEVGFGVIFSFFVTDTTVLDLRYTWFDDMAEPTVDEITDYRLRVEPLEVGLSFIHPLSHDTTFHVGGGLGYYMVDGKIETVPGVLVNYDPKDEIGLYAVVGLETIVSYGMAEKSTADAVTLFAELMYRAVDIDEAKTTTGARRVVQDGNLSGLGANAGIRFRW